MKRIFVSVINDMTNDQRVNRVCNSLCDMGFDVVVLCRRMKSSAELDSRRYKVKRFRLLFNKGMLFYASFNIRLFFYLLFHRCDAFLANDLDTLFANALISKLKRKNLYYDTHELFTELPELLNSGFKKKVWLWIERRCIHRPVATYTVCNSIAKYYNEKYGLDMKVVRNLPTSKEMKSYDGRENILLYQGALNMGRGIELLIEMMKHIPDYKLYIAGKGYMDSELKKLTANLNLNDKVVFTGNLRFDELHDLTSRAKIGFSVEQGESLNYKYALPNKLFDYIQAGTPVVCSDFPEMRAVVEEYAVGEIFAGHHAESLAMLVKNMLDDKDKLNEYHRNCIEASKVLNWENEQKVLYGIYEGK